MQDGRADNRVPRGALPDAETEDAVYLFKHVSTLRATYQVRLLTYLAASRKKKLIIRVPRGFTAAPSLLALMEKVPGVIVIEGA